MGQSIQLFSCVSACKSPAEYNRPRSSGDRQYYCCSSAGPQPSNPNDLTIEPFVVCTELRCSLLSHTGTARGSGEILK